METQNKSLSLKNWLRISSKSIYNEFWGEDIDHPIIRRMLAFIIDFLIVFSINVIPLIAQFFGLVIDLESHIILSINLLLCILYFTLLNSRTGGGQTIGKRVFKIKVTSEQGDPISPIKSLLRSLPITLFIHWYLIVFTLASNDLPFRYIVHVLLIFVYGTLYFSTVKLNRQGLHDLIFGTQVIQKGSAIHTTKNLNPGVVLGFVLPVVVYLAYWLIR